MTLDECRQNNGKLKKIRYRKSAVGCREPHTCVRTLTWIKLSEKSAQDQIRIKENGSADLWLKSVFTKEGSAEPKICKNFS